MDSIVSAASVIAAGLAIATGLKTIAKIVGIGVPKGGAAGGGGNRLGGGAVHGHWRAVPRSARRPAAAVDAGLQWRLAGGGRIGARVRGDACLYGAVGELFQLPCTAFPDDGGEAVLRWPEPDGCGELVRELEVGTIRHAAVTVSGKDQRPVARTA